MRFGYTKNGKSVSIIVIMKITILSLIVVLLASGCSRKSVESTAKSTAKTTAETTTTAGLPQFVLAVGDISAPAETYTDRFGTFHVQIKLSTARADDLHAFMRQHLNQMTELLAGTNVITRVSVLPDPALVPTGGVVEITGSTADDAHHTAVELDKLVR